MLQIGIDTGGTFTDFVVADTERIWSFKLPSTPGEPERAVLDGLQQVMEAVPEAQELEVIHGTTVATNTVLERKGARTAFVTTRGFEDLLEIGRQNRRELYRLGPSKATPLVPRQWRWGLAERVLPDGLIEQELDPAEVRALLDSLRKEQIESVAVCFLFSFRKPLHEQVAGEILREAGFPVSLSCEVLPEFREYERASATVLNAYLQQKVTAYLEKLRVGVDRVARSIKRKRFWLMQSNGGWVSPTLAAQFPVRAIFSGPAAGVYGGWTVGQEAGLSRVITLDIGGTSADVSLVDGEIFRTKESTIDGLPLPLPVVDVQSVGAGGGSIAWVDAGGALRVGPQSAGADPGPLCLGRGTEPTVTDAHLVLGRLDPRSLLLGERQEALERSWKGLARFCQRFRGGSGEEDISEVAQGILEIANTHMARAIRAVSLARGWDPRDFILISFGGAGGLHACELAELFGIDEVLVPPLPGLVSAWGALCAETVLDASKTLLCEASAGSLGRWELVFEELEQKLVRELEAEGFAGGEAIFQRYCDLRYRGQSYELTVPWKASFLEEFHSLHGKRYGYAQQNWPVELVTARATVRIPKPKPKGLMVQSEICQEVRSGRAYFLGRDWPVHYVPRSALRPGDELEGPVIVTEYGGTTVIPPGWRGSVDVMGNLRIRRQSQWTRSS
ncbi:hydantoinase/oxoprolinase family protein [Candidatus Methylacidithermus pantelleriae]|uniref:N-methylhydantoinase A n=1 Tax=Candidatus Methylacidithermus pantelleriae TaxID=2744239 RepID=A0A8J2BT45_9BACT|nr:hydantoinase/oxoprolinase family protein [Candidatus Methylacidithermus pantelleriae]CAF0705368.1 N-methylhydantoinase A [Candidatus Methylacidithermus pantelleriae]